MVASSNGVLDGETMARLRELAEATDASLLNEIIESFITDGQERLGILRDAQQKGEAETMRKAAHALKGSSANIGATGMAHLCEELQALGLTGSVLGAGELIGKLASEFDLVHAALNKEVGNGI